MAQSTHDTAGMKTTTHNDSERTVHPVEHEIGGDTIPMLRVAPVDVENREPEEALEIHEVVELNKFTTKKEWIEEKIKLLESIPPVEIFAAVEALASMKEEIPTALPTRAQLDHWLEDHDNIEKETEIFDAEDMSKLKKLTKAATQRNLSSEDTDLIELTLTTLLALDKLLHLLRDRSETLDLLGLRLTWEEQRVAAWRERSSILSDLRTFLITRARWSLDAYDPPLVHTPSTSPALRFTSPSPSPRPSSSLSKRRDSTASLTSISSDTSISTTASPAFSRSTRYKLAELLSHDAALFSGRLTALNHGKIMPAGKTLDRLIDASRTPIPDEILDEQDRLEDKGIKEIETVGKFAMSVVMQWKRADEHYNDIKKDQAAAEALIVEVSNARLQHPTGRRDAAFMSRAQALNKRLVVKGDPALPRSSFPRPTHSLFQDQGASNEAIVHTLSTELSEALKLARQAEAAAFAYHAELEAVKRAESLRDQMRDFDEQLKKLCASLVQGVHDQNGHGDGSPLDLDAETCLDPTRHATFLALLPSMVQQLELVDQASETALRDGKAALLRLRELPAVDTQLKRELAGVIEMLEGTRGAAKWTKEDVLTKAQKLKEARRFWGVLNDITRVSDGLRKDVLDGLDNQRWKKANESHDGAPLTPDADSPAPSPTPLPTTLTPTSLLLQLDELGGRLDAEFKLPFTTFAQALGNPLRLHLLSSSEGVAKHIDGVRHMTRVWENVLKQAESMLTATREAHDFEGKVETLQAEIDDTRQEILGGNKALEEVALLDTGFRENANELQASIRTFIDSMTTRVTFVSRMDGNRIHPRPNSFSTYSSLSNQQNLNSLKALPAVTLPYDLSTLDNDVRAEVNAFSLRLSGGIQSVDRKLDYLHVTRLAKTMDGVLERLVQDVRSSEQAFSDIKESFEAIEKATPSGLDISFSQKLSSIREQLEHFMQDHRTRISRSGSPVRQALDALQTARGASDSPIHGMLVVPCAKSVDDASSRADSLSESGAQLSARIVEAVRQEDVRLHIEQQRFEAEEKAKLEKARLEAEKARLEEERMEAEKLARKEREQLEAEESARRERKRLDAEERTQLEQLQVENKENTGTTPRPEEEQLEAERGVRRGQERIEECAEVGRANPEGKQDQAREQGEAMSRELQQNVVLKTQDIPEEDVFGLRAAPITISASSLSQEMMALHARIMSLRSRLKSLNLPGLVRPTSEAYDNDAALPTSCQASGLQSKFDAVVSDCSALRVCVKEDAIDSELKSLRSEVDTASGLVRRVIQLGQFADKVAACDYAFSDLLEHADSYPAAPPVDQLSSTHVSDSRLPCEEQLASRLAFTQHIVEEVSHLGSSLFEDLRVVGEQRRIRQTMAELLEMCEDRLNGTRSRPTSSISSAGRSRDSTQRKPTLNAHGRHPKAAGPSTRRIASGVHDPIRRPSTHLSNRSVSGPSGVSSLFNTTFASRQRTTSLASIHSTVTTPLKRPMSPVAKPRTLSKRPGSPAFSEVSGYSIASTPSRSTWSRAPRSSFVVTPRLPDRAPKRKAYVANPKSKLDVAVGNVVNNFKVPVAIHAVDDGWKDQSGKYWIGEDEPKLCFCRILRSQTVMVRVGGGWCELSNFLKGHFAELSIEVSPPPRQEERWINSATVLEALEVPASMTTPRGLKTPDPQKPGLLPAIQLSASKDISPQSIRTSSSSGGSPGLMPFQFMRKADPGARPITPSPSKGGRSKLTTPSTNVTPARTNIWRP